SSSPAASLKVAELPSPMIGTSSPVEGIGRVISSPRPCAAPRRGARASAAPACAVSASTSRRVIIGYSSSLLLVRNRSKVSPWPGVRSGERLAAPLSSAVTRRAGQRGARLRGQCEYFPSSDHRLLLQPSSCTESDQGITPARAGEGGGLRAVSRRFRAVNRLLDSKSRFLVS